MKTKKNKHALVICNGEMPSKNLIAPLLKTKPFILCADGGANKARSFSIEPDCIIGDLDSITQKTRQFYSSVETIHIADQNSTDLEKGLDHLLKLGIGSATIVGATGNRPDHALSNFSILVKYHQRLQLHFLDDYCSIEVVQKSVRFRAVIGQQISIIPMGTCSGIVTTGLKYPLKKESLALGVREGSSNEAVAPTVTITCRKGSLLLFKIHPDSTRL